MAKQNLGKIMMTPKGVYNNSTTYEFLDVVTYNGSSYVCKQATTGNLPTTDYWQQLAYKGDKPVVGVDYFTEVDKKEIADSVIESSSEDIDELFNALPSNKATGTEINVTDSINCRCIETKFNGMSIQDGEPNPTTTVEIVSLGYENLFDKDNIIDGWIRATDNKYYNEAGTFSCADYIKVEPNTTYTLNLHNAMSLGAGGIMEYDTNKNWLEIGTPELNRLMTFTTSENTYYLRFTVRNDSLNFIQLNKGSTAHAYVPYGKYGVEVKTVGKNLFNYNDTYYTRDSQCSISMSNDDTSLINKNELSNGFVWWNIPVELDKDITISYSDLITTSTNGNNRVQYVFSDVKFTSYSADILGLAPVIDKTDKKVTVTSTAKYLVLMIRASNGATTTLSKLQVEYGTVATDYVPYREPYTSVIPLNEPLRSIGDVKDIAYLKNNKLYVDRYIGSVVLNGSETFNTLSSPNRFAITKAYNVVDDTQQYSSHYVWGAWGNADYSIDIRTNGIRINNKDNLTIDEYKTWLSTNNVQVDYQLATPVTEYLGTVQDLPRTFEGSCNITADSNLDNIELEVKYAQDIKAYINNLIK